MKIFEITEVEDEVLEKKSELMTPISTNIQRIAQNLREIHEVINTVKSKTSYSVSEEDANNLREISRFLQYIIDNQI
jgi:hypothetical protein